LDTGETIAHINDNKNKLCEISEKKIHLELEMDFEKNLLDD